MATERIKLTERKGKAGIRQATSDDKKADWARKIEYFKIKR